MGRLAVAAAGPTAALPPPPPPPFTRRGAGRAAMSLTPSDASAGPDSIYRDASYDGEASYDSGVASYEDSGDGALSVRTRTTSTGGPLSASDLSDPLDDFLRRYTCDVVPDILCAKLKKR